MAGETWAPPNALGEAVATEAAGAASTSTGHLEVTAQTPGGAIDGVVPSSSAVPPESTAADRARAAQLDQLLLLLKEAPYRYDFFQALRRLESLFGRGKAGPRFGAALRPADEPIRLGQEPSLAFAPAALGSLQPGRLGLPPRLMVNFFGLLGPNGPLPLHITEYVRDRSQNAGDPTMRHFLDLFHHRMLMFFYRARASVEPTVAQDRPDTNRFWTYVGSLVGIGLPSLRGRNRFPDHAKLYYAGLFSPQARNLEGLRAVIGDFFGMPAEVQPFVGDWLDIPTDYQWRLGQKGPNNVGLLGSSTILGRRAWTRQQKFRVVMGPLNRTQFQRMLPGGSSIGALTDLVRQYAGDELRWDLRLYLQDQVDEPWTLNQSRLGWTSWVGRPPPGRREDLILDPQSGIYQSKAAA